MRKCFFLSLLNLLLFVFASHSFASESVQLKIDQAKPGATVYIEEGIYIEPISINKSINLIGKGNVVLKNQTEQPYILIKDTANVHVENISIEGSDKKTTGIMVNNSEGVTIKDVQLSSMKKGIELTEVKSSQLHNVIINGIEGHFSNKGNGVTLYNTINIALSNFHIDSFLDGIYIENDQGAKILNSQVSNSRYGIHLMYTRDNEVVQNELEDNITGIMQMVTSNTLIKENLIAHQSDYNGYGLVLFEGEDATIQDNRFEYNQVGLSLQKVRKSTIKDNVISGNQTGVQFLNYNSTNLFNQNQLYGNILSSISGTEGAIVTENFWDDYTGFDMNHDMFGDTPYHSSDSFAKLINQHQAFQFFFESPAVTMLNKLEKKLSIDYESVVIDQKPFIQSAEQEGQISFDKSLFGLSILLIGGGVVLWRRSSS
ncbi:NosD domain-containing protein [Bacillus carboniphilus]|uniref:NosD domain-containing protein n=1 Tax=Bacillus carboniphilus TaxID=86663 RepID=A0ABY9JP90_9BACI|nr:NosD domain-containing protein [Bacillus carboniphilus]WLR41226.1 NosD domain-containing protein [Bacillus carboniphilus]